VRNIFSKEDLRALRTVKAKERNAKTLSLKEVKNFCILINFLTTQLKYGN
jgi:hypothetical protein